MTNFGRTQADIQRERANGRRDGRWFDRAPMGDIEGATANRLLYFWRSSHSRHTGIGAGALQTASVGRPLSMRYTTALSES